MSTSSFGRPSYAAVHAWENLLRAADGAARGKRGRAATAAFEVRRADALIDLRDDLRARTYRPGRYHHFLIHDPKRRLISAAPYRDRVVHHALCQVIEPWFERRFMASSFANRVGKGTHRAMDSCQALARRFRYVLPVDIRQHFAAIDHAVLMDLLAKDIDDEGVRWLCQIIIDSGTDVLEQHYDMVYFPGDDLTAALRPRGLPIGNLTSQFWSNCLLNPFDHFVKRELRCAGYLRYVDDMLLFHDDKATLWAWRRRIVDRLARLRLAIHEARAQVQPTANGIPWLGLVVHPTHRSLKRRNVVNYRRRLAALVAAYRAGRVSYAELHASIAGWANHARHADTYGLRKAVLSSWKL